MFTFLHVWYRTQEELHLLSFHLLQLFLVPLRMVERGYLCPRCRVLALLIASSDPFVDSSYSTLRPCTYKDVEALDHRLVPVRNYNAACVLVDAVDECSALSSVRCTSIFGLDRDCRADLLLPQNRLLDAFWPSERSRRPFHD